MKIILSLLFSLSSFAAHGALPEMGRVDGLTDRSDSGVTYVKYDDLEKQMKDLAAAKPMLAKYVAYGKTLGGRNLNMLRIADEKIMPPNGGMRPSIEISGAIHGNEYLGIEFDLMKSMLNEPETHPGLALFLAAGGVIYYVPIVNPDGYEARARGNQHNVDLNRDWDLLPTQQNFFREPESTALARFLDKDLVASHGVLKFSLDYHCCADGLITPWTYKNAYPTQADVASFQVIAQLEKQTVGFPAGNAMDIVNYLAVGTTVDYFYAKYHALAVTVEGSYGGEMKRFEKHRAWIDAVMQKVAASAFGLDPGFTAY